MPHATGDATPHSIESELRRALRLAGAQRRVDAIAVLRAALAREPAHVAARCLIAAMLHEAGQPSAALAEIEAAPAVLAGQAALEQTRATILLALERPADAERAARLALAADARSPRAWLAVALALEAQRRDADAAESARAALALQPEQALARRVLARSLVRLGRTDDAVVAASGSAADEMAADAIVEDFLAVDANAALRLLEALVQRRPDSYRWLIRTARLLHQLGRSSEALAFSERAHALVPDEIEPLEMRAVALLDRGEIETGLGAYRELLARGTPSAETANRHLILLHYDPAQDNATLFREHVAWVRDHVQPFGSPFAPRGDADPQRPLRVAWLSPRFEGGPVASFLAGLLAAFDREHFSHTLVALRQTDPAAAARFRRPGDDWLSLHELADDALLQRLRDAGFDVVVDLAGHSFGNRLRVLAQRVAPIQLCWLDYFDTTAVPAIDGWISDAWLTPPDSTQRFTERVHRLASGRFCYALPEPIACEHVGGDSPVFASFNRPAKFNDGVLDAWAEVLRRVPAARLELGAALFADPVACARTLERFGERGIAADRVRLHGQREYRELLQAYRGVDVALDPFPFSGCTTTCDALWMGVPVVTRSGETFVARQSASLLQRLGCDEWIAADGEGYVERAVTLSGNVAELRARRDALRARMQDRLCDNAAQARDFAVLLRDLWREYCAAAAGR